MDIYKVVNLFCGIAGIAVLVFAAIVRMDMIATVDPSKSTILFILSAIIIIWALLSNHRHR